MSNSSVVPKFPLGDIVATPGALQALSSSKQTPEEFLLRHVIGDWGEVSPGDRQLNEQALIDGSRILSAYITAEGEKLWVITEADRSSTCLLLPAEY